MDKRRDLVDFLIILECKKYVFYILLVVSLVISMFASINANNTYSYRKILTVSPDDAFSGVYRYQKDVLEAAGFDTDDVIGRKSVDGILKALLDDSIFYQELSTRYLNSKFGINNVLPVEDIVFEMSNSIEYSNDIKWQYVLKVETQYEAVAHFLYYEMSSIIDTIIAKRFLDYINKIKESSVLKLESLSQLQIEEIKVGVFNSFESKKNKAFDLSKLEINFSGLREEPHKYSPAYANLKSIERKKMPETRINYTVSTVSKIKEISNLNIYLALILSVFLSMFVYLFYILFYDLKIQISDRREV